MKVFVLSLLVSVPAWSSNLGVMPGFEKDQICTTYNAYVDTQCAPREKVAKLVDKKILGNYTADKCRKESFQMILDTDEKAKSACDINVVSSQGLSLKDKTQN